MRLGRGRRHVAARKKGADAAVATTERNCDARRKFGVTREEDRCAKSAQQGRGLGSVSFWCHVAEFRTFELVPLQVELLQRREPPD